MRFGYLEKSGIYYSFYYPHHLVRHAALDTAG
jgi:hypothetical protein